MKLRTFLAALGGALALGLCSAPLLAQTAPVQPPIWNKVGICDIVHPGNCATPDSSGNLPVTGSFSATVGGFRPTAFGTAVSATNVSSTQSLPAGAQVVATNISATVGVYCALGATATTASQFIPPNSWFGFAVSGDTQISCITASSTATVNTAGGTGLPTGANGGSSVLPTGASTAANQATEIASLASIDTKTPTWVADPCQANAKTSVAISQAASAKLFSQVSAKKNYICSIVVVGSDAENVSLVEGTGSTCGTNTAAIIGGTTAANGPNLAANGGFSMGSGIATIASGTNNNFDVCLFQSASGRVAGVLTYVQQ